MPMLRACVPIRTFAPIRGSERQQCEIGSWMPFRTGLLDGDFPPVSIPVPRASGSTVSDPVLIHSVASPGGGKRPMATDLDGNIIWYMRSPEFLTRVLPGGRFLVLSEGANRRTT